MLAVSNLTNRLTIRGLFSVKAKRGPKWVLFLVR